MSQDMIQFGSPRRRPRWHGPRWHGPRLRWPVWLGLAVAALTAVIVTAAVTHGKKPPPAAVTVTVTETGHPLLGESGRWELFARGPQAVIGIDPARGRVTRTILPPLDSTGAVSFIAAPGEVIIRPLDFVPGYLVPDGRPARGLPGVLNRGGDVIPGPGPRFLWVQAAGGRRTVMSVAGLDGRMTGVSITLPGRNLWPLAPDGRGYFLFQGSDGVYDAHPGGLLYRVTTGSVAAVGGARWLAVECAPGPRCRYVVVDSATGARRVLPGPAAPVGTVPGVISPDGSMAAFFSVASAGNSTLNLVDLATGAAHLAGVRPQDPGYGALAWSPDGKWLFVVAAGGKLVAVDARSLHARGLGVALPPISQVVVRAAGASNAPPTPARPGRELSASRPG